MLQYRLYGGNSLPPGLEGFVKAGANIGSVIGQFTFGKSIFSTPYSAAKLTYTRPQGYLADALGRKAVCRFILKVMIATSI